MWAGEAFKYSAEAIKHIGDEMWSKAGPKIEAAAQAYHVGRRLQKETPKAAQVNKELKRLSKSIQRVIDASEDLDDLTLNTIQIWAMRLFREPTQTDILAWRDALSLLASWLEDAADDNSRPGPPRDWARRCFVRLLADVWGEVHGEWPKRRHDDLTGRDVGPFYDFARACDAPFNPSGQGLEDLIKEVIAMGKDRHQKSSD